MSVTPARRPLPGIHYAWVIVGITFLVLLTGAGIRSTPGILMVPLEGEFGWSRATIGLAVSINLILYGLIGPFAAAAMERFGIRRSVVVALLLMGVGVAGTSVMRHSWELILVWGIVVGTGAGFVATVLAATIAARWFTEKRGLVVGILSGGASAGQLIFLPAMAKISATFGWRATVLAIAAVLAVIIPLVWLFLRDRPGDIGLRPYGDKDSPPPAPKQQGNPLVLAFQTLHEAVRVREFWLMALLFFVCGASTNGLIGTHLVATCVDYGYSEVTGAALLATIGLFNFVGTIGSGWLTDRVDNRLLLAIYFSLRGLALIYLPFSLDNYYAMTLFAVFYGLDWFATVSPTVRIITMSFGAERVSMVYGWVFVFHQLGGAAAAFLAGLMRGALDSYTSSFMLAGTLCLLAAMTTPFIGGGRVAGRAQPKTA